MGLPIFGTSNNTTPHWQEDPNERGTWDLLQSCLVTLALCVYTSIHINVFNSEVGTWSRFWIRVKWALIALLIPELIVFNAWVQRRLAHRITKVLRARSGQEEPPFIIVRFKRWLVKKLTKKFRKWRKPKPGVPEPPSEDVERGKSFEDQLGRTQAQTDRLKSHSPHPSPNKKRFLEFLWNTSIRVKDWYFRKTPNRHEPEVFGLKHGFTIAIDGLVIDRSTILQPDSKRCRFRTLTTPGFLHLFATDSPNYNACQDIDFGSFLTIKNIDAKQKRDVLAKTIVITQTLWFCIQFLARIQQRLPVSLLELNTFAHAICTLLIFPLWWQKPVDIEDPFVLDGTKCEPLLHICRPHPQHALFLLPEGFKRDEYIEDGIKLFVRSRIRNTSFREYRGMFYDFENGRLRHEVKEVVLPHLMYSLASNLYGALHLLAWDSGAFKKTGNDATLWEVACLLLVPCGAIYLLIVACLMIGKVTGMVERWLERIETTRDGEKIRVWRFRGRMKIKEKVRVKTNRMLKAREQEVERTSPSSTMAAADAKKSSTEVEETVVEKEKVIVAKVVDVVVFSILGLLGVTALLLYAASRVYIQVAVFQAVTYADPGVYKNPSFSSYFPHY